MTRCFGHDDPAPAPRTSRALPVAVIAMLALSGLAVSQDVSCNRNERAEAQASTAASRVGPAGPGGDPGARASSGHGAAETELAGSQH